MRIKVNDKSKEQKVRVRQFGVLEGAIKIAMVNGNLIALIDRAALRGRRIFTLGEQV